MTQDVYYVYAKMAKNKFFMVDVWMRRADGFAEGVFACYFLGLIAVVILTMPFF